jgi:hypothetical protein
LSTWTAPPAGSAAMSSFVSPEPEPDTARGVGPATTTLTTAGPAELPGPLGGSADVLSDGLGEALG